MQALAAKGGDGAYPSILAAATRSLSNTQEDCEANPDHGIGEDVTTLEHGLRALRAVYDEFDVGIRELRA